MVSRFEQFSTSIACINRYIQKIERVEMAKFGLKGPHVQCMLSLSRYPEGLTSSQLCTVCDKDKAAISRIVAELEREGMIRRTCVGSNRYRALLTLTEAGERIARDVNDRVSFAVEKAGEGLTDEQRKTYVAALARIAGNLQTICADGLEEQEL